MTAHYEIVGVRALHWARDTRTPRTEVIISADRLGGYSFGQIRETARFLSGERNDDGMVDFWPTVGGGVMVRKAGGEPAAFFVGGKPGTKDWPPFADMDTEPDRDYKNPRRVPGMTDAELAGALTSGMIVAPADYREAVLAEAAARLRAGRR